MGRLLLFLLAAAVVLPACGSDDDGGAAPAPAQPRAAAPASFPSAEGKTLDELVANLPRGAILNVSSFKSQRPGRNRLGFAIVDRANKQIEVSAVAVYTARPDGSQLRGPFVARKESLDVDTRYRSAQTASDLASGDTFYVAEAVYGSRGPHVAIGLVRLDGRLVVAESVGPLMVGEKGGPPQVGEPAIKVHTQTAADVGGDLTKLSTRIPPPPEMLDTDFADVLGKKPVVLLFATPALCASRTCGPVVDIAEQVRAENGKGVTFIQQEIYQDNDPGKPYREQVLAWRLPTEPWAFVIDREGKVAARFEGVFSVGELARAVERVK
ncbi:MAG TPA: thioredoxin family protein [Solirubrobacteraceae bacterium]|nr:thioredoxin family protein [Solirubrobacteraceae bacterium]